MKKTLFFLSLLIAFVMVSCDNKLMMTLPEGPQGPQGESGLSAFDLWKEFYGKPDATLEEFLNSLKGEKGEKGDTPAFNVTIGDDNFWYINGQSTGVKATGSDGIDGVSPDFDVEIGKGEAMKYIVALKNQADAAQLSVRVGIAVAKSDGDFDMDEQKAVKEVISSLGLDAADFGL